MAANNSGSCGSGGDGVLDNVTSRCRQGCSTSTPPLSINYDQPELAVVGLALVCVVVTTMLCNLLVGFALLRFPSLRNVSNLLIGNLALSDFLLSVAVLPLSAVNECLGHWVVWVAACVVSALCPDPLGGRGLHHTGWSQVTFTSLISFRHNSTELDWTEDLVLFSSARINEIIQSNLNAPSVSLLGGLGPVSDLGLLGGWSMSSVSVFSPRSLGVLVWSTRCSDISSELNWTDLDGGHVLVHSSTVRLDQMR